MKTHFTYDYVTSLRFLKALVRLLRLLWRLLTFVGKGDQSSPEPDVTQPPWPPYGYVPLNTPGFY